MSRRGCNPCLICSDLTRGPKGGVVCPECIDKVRHYDAVMARLASGKLRIDLPTYPFVPGRGRAEGNSDREFLDQLLRELREALPRPWAPAYMDRPPEAPAPRADEAGIKRRVRYSHEARDYQPFNVPAELAQFLIDLEPAIFHALHEAHSEGKREGSNLLAQLAAGNLTTDEFHRKAGIA